MMHRASPTRSSHSGGPSSIRLFPSAEAEAARIGERAGSAGSDLRLSGPAPAPLERLKGQWRFQLLLRTADRKSLLAALEACAPGRPPSGVHVAVDVDPQDLM